MSLDWKARVEAPLSPHVFANCGGTLPRPVPAVAVHEIEVGDVVEHAHWQVTTARARHVQPWLTSLAYRLDANGKSIVFTGDSGPCQAITELARGADVMVMHCWDHRAIMNENGEAGGIAGTRDHVSRGSSSIASLTLFLPHARALASTALVTVCSLVCLTPNPPPSVPPPRSTDAHSHGPTTPHPNPL